MALNNDPNAPPTPAPGLTPAQQQEWFQMMMDSQRELGNIRNRSASGPEMQYRPLEETYKDAAGNVVPQGTPGAKQSIDLRKEFKLSGPESYIESLMMKQKGEEAGQRDDAMLGAAQTNAIARNQKAMRGGVRSGDQRSMDVNLARDLMASRQNIARTGSENRMQISNKGEELKRGTEAYNLENALKGAEYTNKFELEKSKQAASVEAARLSADATRAAGNGGGGGSYGGMYWVRKTWSFRYG